MVPVPVIESIILPAVRVKVPLFVTAPVIPVVAVPAESVLEASVVKLLPLFIVNAVFISAELRIFPEIMVSPIPNMSTLFAVPFNSSSLLFVTNPSPTVRFVIVNLPSVIVTVFCVRLAAVVAPPRISVTPVPAVSIIFSKEFVPLRFNLPLLSTSAVVFVLKVESDIFKVPFALFVTAVEPNPLHSPAFLIVRDCSAVPNVTPL